MSLNMCPNMYATCICIIFQQGSLRASSSHQRDLPSWRLLHQDFFVDSNPRIELVRNLLIINSSHTSDDRNSESDTFKFSPTFPNFIPQNIEKQAV